MAHGRKPVALTASVAVVVACLVLVAGCAGPAARVGAARPTTVVPESARTGHTVHRDAVRVPPATARMVPLPRARPLGSLLAAPGRPRTLPRGAVALTFDDGPDPTWTPRVLAVLRRYHAYATFFDIGREVAAHPGLVRAEYAAGDGVGDHTWSHPDLTRLQPDQVAQQIGWTAMAIRAATGASPVCLRPPYDTFDGMTETVTAQEHEATMIYDVDPQDWSRPGVEQIVQRVLAAIRPGSVVDLHDAGGDRSQTVAALPGILAGLRARHLVPVPICRA